jgi:NitT/TauT family transport system substrate-binding protein
MSRFEKKEGLDSLIGSGKVADDFNVANKVYEKSQPVAEYLDGSLMREAMGSPTAAAK